MKKLILTGKQCHLLLKVENAEPGFYVNVTNFLEENKDLPEGETAELEFADEDTDEFENVTEVVKEYLGYYFHEGDDVPTEQEIIELHELIKQLNSDHPKDSAEEKPTEDTTGTEETK